jgi:hypothetical protein
MCTRPALVARTPARTMADTDTGKPCCPLRTKKAPSTRGPPWMLLKCSSARNCGARGLKRGRGGGAARARPRAPAGGGGARRPGWSGGRAGGRPASRRRAGRRALRGRRAAGRRGAAGRARPLPPAWRPAAGHASWPRFGWAAPEPARLGEALCGAGVHRGLQPAAAGEPRRRQEAQGQDVGGPQRERRERRSSSPAHRWR